MYKWFSILFYAVIITTGVMLLVYIHDPAGNNGAFKDGLIALAIGQLALAVLMLFLSFTDDANNGYQQQQQLYQ